MVRRGLDAEILVNTCGTIDLCDIGPNLVIYPDNIIYRGVSVKDIPDVLEHLRGGPVVERLVVGPDAEEESQRRLFYAEAVSPAAARSAEAFMGAARIHGFDEGWVQEQQRRGFIARKPGSDVEPETITVTKKARDRYGI